MIKKSIAIIIILFVASQFLSPKKNEGDLESVNVFLAETNPSKEVKEILKNACYDCHTDHTNYPWYFSITPVNFRMAHHIEEGKEHLNFSNWSAYSDKRKAHKMMEFYEEVEKRKMPLKTYTLTHSEAKLTQEQIDLVVNWAKQVEKQYAVK